MSLEDLLLLVVSLNLILTLILLAKIGSVKNELSKLRRQRLAAKPAIRKKGRP